MKGSCFCGEVQFEINVDRVDAYHCHCSICRKVTGSKFNTAFTLSASDFTWIGQNDGVKSFQKNGGGFRHDFCGDCGCTVPNRYQDVMFWVPVGLLEDDDRIEVSKHIFVKSKADWDVICDELPQFDGYP
ncbi:MAG: GFA family protein [Gammaproteobacteria bacterium]